jgi:hypothetical protein
MRDARAYGKSDSNAAVHDRKIGILPVRMRTPSLGGQNPDLVKSPGVRLPRGLFLNLHKIRVDSDNKR